MAFPVSDKELRRLARLMRKEGLRALQWKGVRLELGDRPARPQRVSPEDLGPEEKEPTYEELLLWSAGGGPVANPPETK